MLERLQVHLAAARCRAWRATQRAQQAAGLAGCGAYRATQRAQQAARLGAAHRALTAGREARFPACHLWQLHIQPCIRTAPHPIIYSYSSHPTPSPIRLHPTAPLTADCGSCSAAVATRPTSDWNCSFRATKSVSLLICGGRGPQLGLVGRAEGTCVKQGSGFGAAWHHQPAVAHRAGAASGSTRTMGKALAHATCFTAAAAISAYAPAGPLSFC